MSVGIEAARISVVTTADTKSAEDGLRKLDGALKKTGDSAQTAAQKIAVELGQKADNLESDLRKGTAAAHALAVALGPELTAKVDVQGLVGQFRDLGAEFEDIQANADQLAASVRKVADIEQHMPGATASMSGFADTVKRTGTEADRSRGVMANFMGNMAQDIPGINGSFGALNVAIGQFAEYATEGGIKLGGLVTALGPIALGTVAVGTLASHFKNIAETKAFNREKVDGFVQALKDGQTAAEALKKQIIETGKIEFRTGDMSKVKDLAPDLAKVNLGMNDYFDILGMSASQLDEWSKKMYGADVRTVVAARNNYELGKSIGVSHDQAMAFVRVLNAAGQTTDNFNTAAAELAQQNLVLYGTMHYATGEAQNAAQWIGAMAQGVQTAGRSAVEASPGVDTLGVAFGTAAVHAGDMADEAARADEKIRALADTVVGRADAAFAYADQVRATAELGAEYAKAQTRAGRRGASTKDKEDAKKLEEDYAQALLHTAEAFAEQSDAVKNAKDETEKAKAKNDLMAQSLQAQADKLAPGSPLRQYLAEWIAELQGIPSVVSTTIALAGTGKNLGSLLPGIQMAEGGIVMPRPGGTLATIGEAGKPEAVIPLDRLGNFGGGNTYYLTVQIAPGGDLVAAGRQMQEAIVEAERVYGKGWREAA